MPKIKRIHFYHIPRTGGHSVYKFYPRIRKFGIQMPNNGHTPYQDYNIPSFIFLRNPAMHSFSSYHYIREHKTHKLHNEMLRKSFTQILREGQPLDRFCGFLGRGAKTPKERLERAKRNIDKITFVGFTERFDEDMNIFLRDILGVPLRYNRAVVNSSNVYKKKLRPSPTDIKLLKELRADDYELVRYVMKKRNVRIPL